MLQTDDITQNYTDTEPLEEGGRMDVRQSLDAVTPSD